ncbi:carcinine transporter [Toxorhynchites rutilus septentrionalis]|uniref:carcinine transporter n=1 Tax=Toxorhynchites rutilus septentrionalis TaxID=329112 RepID=UPI002479BCF6|nr:carcinine transporter [Toxorhynchites rutilus septentrionalis]
MDGKGETLVEENEKIVSEEPFDLDELLPAIGEFGRYQKLLLWLICLPACIPCGFCAFNQLFMTDVPEEYWCKIPELQNFSAAERKLYGIPMAEHDGESGYSKCYRYAVDWKEILANNDLTAVIPNNSWPVEPCREGWEYNTTYVTSSIVIDFNLVCEYDIYPTLGLVALNTGGPVGVYLFGMLNDRAGRRISYFSCLATLLLGSFITAASNSFGMWAFSRVIVGLTIPAVYQIPFIIALELVGPNYRSFVTVMTCTFYTVGLMMLAGVTYLVRDWVKLTLYTSVPFLLYFLYLLVMPESPRWLLMKGKLEEALQILEKMAKVNGKQFPAAFKNKLQERVLAEKRRTVKKEEVSIGAFDLCRTPNMRLKTFLITLNWFVNETVYLGLSYYGPSLGENQYLSFFLSSLVEIPSYIICWIIMDRFGRRWPMCMLMILGGISCVTTVVLPEDAVTETLFLYLLSKSMISASFLIIYPFAGELYPTQVRGVGIGTSSYIGGLGLIVIPFITYLGKENLVLPLVIMGCVSVAGGFTGLRLPETLHHRLPQTLEEGEEFGKDWTFDDCFRCSSPKLSPSGSYENLSHEPSDTALELNSAIPINVDLYETPTPSETEKTPLEYARIRRQTMRRIARQASTMDTQKTADGAIQLTYWF